MTSNHNNIPSWITAKLFEKVLRESVGEFKEIQSFKAYNALGPGENYCTLMLRVQIEVLLPDDSSQTKMFMLKVAHDNKTYREQISKWELFKKEAGMYRDVVPELEQLYRNKGVEVRFGAKAYELPVAEEYILLEDLSKRGFRNAKRQDCLDMVHTKSVLRKLAQWHAASAVRVAQKGPYDKQYLEGFLSENIREMSDQMYRGSLKYVLATTRKLPGNQEYYGKFESLCSSLTDVVYAQAQAEKDANDFKVLNHGDFWCNNIMFRYDEEGNLRETNFVDYQMPRYGTVAQDLLYFILSSTQLDFKVDRFDELIRYYYDHLVNNLKVLEYSKPLPNLRDIHRSLLKMGAMGLATVCSIMSAVLCDPTDFANIDNFVESSEDGDKFKQMLYFNDRFIQHLGVVLPWLYYRGAFEA